MIKRIWGMEPNKSIIPATVSSANLLKLENKPRIIEIKVLTAEAIKPTIILKPRPAIVRWNMSLPIQSVPNICSNEGIWLALTKLVGISRTKYPEINIETIIITEKTMITIVLVLRFAGYKNHCFLSSDCFLITEFTLLDSRID